VGIELGVDTDHIVVTDLRQNILETVSFSNERPTADPIAEIVQRVVRTIETPGYSLKEIIGIGLSAAIQFNSHNASGRIVSFTNECANLIGSQLTKELNIHVYVGRPQVMIAYDTHWRTLIADKTSFVSAFFAHNVGISHFVEGKPYGGSSGLGADLGHLKIPFSNRTCYCGRSGCFRTIVSYEGVAQTLSERAKLIPQLASRYTRSPLGSAIDSPESAVREVVQLARNGNSFGVDLVATLGEQIGSTLSSAVSLFHPSALSIHSCYVDAGPVFTDPVTIALRRSCLELYTENLEIDFYGLSPQNIARGSASFAIIRSMEELVSYQEDTRKR